MLYPICKRCGGPKRRQRGVNYCENCSIIATRENRQRCYAKGRNERNYRPVGNRRDTEYRRNYRITLAEYEAMLSSQGGVCAICSAPPPTGKRIRFHAVDHDHATGRIRGILCHRCNALVDMTEKYRTEIDRYLEEP